MATIVNQPPAQTNTNNGGYGFLLGIILLIAFVLLVFYYGLPYLRGSANTAAPQVNVPGKIDVNVQQPK